MVKQRISGMRKSTIRFVKRFVRIKKCFAGGWEEPSNRLLFRKMTVDQKRPAQEREKGRK